jgi:hypothetical protein
MKNSDKPINVIENRRASDGFPYYLTGLTKREYFAGLALQGLCSDKGNLQAYRSVSLDSEKGEATLMIEDAVCLADLLLKELDV